MLDRGCRYGMIDVKHSRWGSPLAGMNPWRLCSARVNDVYASQPALHLVATSCGLWLAKLAVASAPRNGRRI
jgi:hypothetical protein